MGEFPAPCWTFGWSFCPRKMANWLKADQCSCCGTGALHMPSDSKSFDTVWLHPLISEGYCMLLYDIHQYSSSEHLPDISRPSTVGLIRKYHWRTPLGHNPWIHMRNPLVSAHGLPSGHWISNCEVWFLMGRLYGRLISTLCITYIYIYIQSTANLCAFLWLELPVCVWVKTGYPKDCWMVNIYLITNLCSPGVWFLVSTKTLSCWMILAATSILTSILLGL